MTFFKLGKPLGKVGREIVVCVAFVYKNKKPHQNPTCISNGPHLYLFHNKQIAFTSLIPDWESEMTNPSLCSAQRCGFIGCHSGFLVKLEWETTPFHWKKKKNEEEIFSFMLGCLYDCEIFRWPWFNGLSFVLSTAGDHLFLLLFFLSFFFFFLPDSSCWPLSTSFVETPKDHLFAASGP